MKNIGLINIGKSNIIKTMDKLEVRVRIFECLYNTQFNGFKRVTDEQIDELVYNTIKIANKLDEDIENYESKN